jgi:DNA-binding transcriptional MocR family regulator
VYDLVAGPGRLLDGEGQDRADLRARPQLPSLTELTGETHLASGTVRRATEVLARERLVQRVPGHGTFVINPDSTGTRHGDQFGHETGLGVNPPRRCGCCTPSQLL